MILRRAWLLLVAITALPGCRLIVDVSEGGNVATASGEFYCGAIAGCNINITAADFEQRFVAVPKPGFRFVQWSGDGFCVETTNPVCDLANTALAGNTNALEVIESNQAFSVVAEFEPLPIEPPGPLQQDYIAVDGNNVPLGDVYYHRNYAASVRHSYVDPTGTTHFTYLELDRDQAYFNRYHTLVWADDTCSGDPPYLGRNVGGSFEEFEPLFSNTLKWSFTYAPGVVQSPDDRIWHLVLIGEDLEDEVELETTYKLWFNGACVETASEAGFIVPVVALLKDWTNQFPPPYRLVPK